MKQKELLEGISDPLLSPWSTNGDTEVPWEETVIWDDGGLFTLVPTQ